MSKLRVIQWATGNIGTRALRAVIDHPELELVGLWVSSDAKIGKDAGALCNAPMTGVLATHSVDQLIAQPADCVLYMRQGTDIDELCQLLAAGKNVVTTRGDFHYPAGMDAAILSKIEAACAQGRVSIYSTGSSPGFITEAMTMPLLSLSRRLDCITIDEFADLESRNSPDLLFNIMGYGAPMAPYDQRRAEHLKADFASSLAQMADAHGIAVDEWQASGELSAASCDIEIAAGTIKAGTVAAQRVSITGMKGSAPRLRFRANWYVSREIENPEWDLRESGWRVHIQGDTPLDLHITFPVAPEDYAAFTPGLTAHRAVNAIAAVCAAPPGIRTSADLPNIIARLA